MSGQALVVHKDRGSTCPACRHREFVAGTGATRVGFVCLRCDHRWSSGRTGEPYFYRAKNVRSTNHPDEFASMEYDSFTGTIRPLHREFNGDLFDGPCRVIAHGCNAKGVMGAGVAAQIKDRFPDAFMAYRAAFEHGGLEPGHIIAHQTPDGFTILNCITQENYGRVGTFVLPDAIWRCFSAINIMGFQKVAIPRIGSGFGGGEWEKIRPIIHKAMSRTSLNVYYI